MYPVIALSILSSNHHDYSRDLALGSVNGALHSLFTVLNISAARSALRRDDADVRLYLFL